MNGHLILTSYIVLNCLLAIAYIFYRSIAWVTRYAKLRIRPITWVRITRLLVLIALTAPTLFHCLPEVHQTNKNWGHFNPGSEGDPALSMTKLSQIHPLPHAVFRSITASQMVTTQVRDFLDRHEALEVGCMIVLVLGVVLKLLFLCLNFIRLRVIMVNAVSIRSYRAVRILASDSITIPFSARFFPFAKTCWVVVPSSLIHRYKDYRISIAHELQHHRQFDTLFAPAMEVLAAFFIFNPAMHFLKREILELQEFSCDEALVGRQSFSLRDYGSCLVRVAETALENHLQYAGTTCMAAIFRNPDQFKSFLRRRIEMFTDNNGSPASQWAAILIGTMGIVATLTVAYGAEQLFRGVRDQVNPGTVILDQAVQKITEKALDDAIKNTHAKSGFAIVANPNTGEVLAIANVDRERKRSDYWALSQNLEPASLIKAIVAAQAIDKGLTTPTESHSCENGSYKVGNHIYHDWKLKGWDHLTTTETVAFSSDICSMKIAEKIGEKGLRDMLSQYGFGPSGTASAFPKASSGTLPPADDSAEKKMIPYVSAGFGFRTTPLELIQAFGAIANGGQLVMPQLAHGSTKTAEVIRRVMTQETAEKMRTILRQVVLQGTAKGKERGESSLYSIAGKTASSYDPDLTEWDLKNRNKKSNFAGFIGFAPVGKPQVEIYVGLHGPKTDKSGSHGGTHAAPVARKIVDDVLRYMKVTPDLPQT